MPQELRCINLKTQINLGQIMPKVRFGFKILAKIS